MSAVLTDYRHGDNRAQIQHCAITRYREGADPTVLADIHDDDADIAIWKRTLPDTLRRSVAQLVDSHPTFRASLAVTPDTALQAFNDTYGEQTSIELRQDIAMLVDMFCMLLNTERAGVRLGVLGGAMCPKFHVDRIPCRLLTTYQGVATEWLPHESVNRSRLGHASEGLTDHESGLFDNPDDIAQLQQGDVALLKGDLWHGNEGKGLVHRSPNIENDRRLLLSMDIIN
jgi:hypothetical protein